MVEKDHRSRDGPLVEPHELSAKERRRGRGPTTRSIGTVADPPARRSGDGDASPEGSAEAPEVRRPR